VGRLKEKLETSQREVGDLQGEFEAEREGLLEELRKQDRAMRFQAAMLEKVLPLLRLDCNYNNLDKIRAQAQWDDDAGTWLMPMVTGSSANAPSHSSGQHSSFSPAPPPPASASASATAAPGVRGETARLRQMMVADSDVPLYIQPVTPVRASEVRSRFATREAEVSWVMLVFLSKLTTSGPTLQVNQKVADRLAQIDTTVSPLRSAEANLLRQPNPPGSVFVECNAV
jgi:hypothetical protein